MASTYHFIPASGHIFLTSLCASKIRLLEANQTFLFPNFFDCLMESYSFSTTHALPSHWHCLWHLLTFSIARVKYFHSLSEACIFSILSYHLLQHFIMKVFKQTEKLKDLCMNVIIAVLPCLRCYISLHPSIHLFKMNFKESCRY